MVGEKGKGLLGDMKEIFEKQQSAAKGYKSQTSKVLANEEERNRQLKRIAVALEKIAASIDIHVVPYRSKSR